jgi:predicted DNA-binding transcriptional regulator YafY
MNESIYYNVDEIHKAINSDSQISFQYFQWGLDKEMELKRDGARYVVSPWALVFDDENYYMVAVEGSSLKHYRVDKMLRIKATGDPRAGRELYHEEEYGKKSLFGMYGGDIVPVTFQAKNWMIGIMIDRFGRDIPIARVNDEEFETRAEVAISPQFFGWLFALGPDIRVTSPGYVVNKLREYGENVMRNYQQP